MNARLRFKLLRQPVQQAATPATPAPEAPELRLLGEGLDAILQATRLPAYGMERLIFPNGINDPSVPNPPTAERRLARYYTAATLFPLHHDIKLAMQREVLGGQFREAWQSHRYPNFARIRASMPKPLRALRLVRS